MSGPMKGDEVEVGVSGSPIHLCVGLPLSSKPQEVLSVVRGRR